MKYFASTVVGFAVTSAAQSFDAGMGSGSAFVPESQRPPESGAVIGPQKQIDLPLPGGITWNRTHSPAVASSEDVVLIVWAESNAEYDESDLIGVRFDVHGQPLDPIPFPISQAGGSQRYPSVASDGNDFLVVWWDSRAGNRIYGARIRSNGEVLDPQGFAISRGQERGFGYPFVASNGTDYLVTWGLFSPLYARRVLPDGTLVDLASEYVSSQPESIPGGVASNGNDYFVVWESRREDDPNGDGDIYGTRVDRAGRVLDTEGISISVQPGAQGAPVVAGAADNYFVAWSDNVPIEDSRSREFDIYGTLVAASGVVRNVGGMPICTERGWQYMPAIASNGDQFLVAWSDGRDPQNYFCGASRISADGTVIDPGGFSVIDLGLQPRAAFGAGVYWIVSPYNYEIICTRVGTDRTLIDPNGLVLSYAANEQSTPSLARNGDATLIAWTDNRNHPRRPRMLTDYDLMVGILSSDGSIQTPRLIGPDHSSPFRPALSSDGQNFLLVYRSASSQFFQTYPWHAVLIDRSGSVLRDTFIPQMDSAGHGISLASDGNGFFLVWGGSVRSLAPFEVSKQGLFGARISPNGQVVDDTPISLNRPTSFVSNPAVASDGSGYLIAWAETSSPGNQDLHVSRMIRTGTVLQFHETVVPGISPYSLAAASDGSNYLVAWFGPINPSRYNDVLGMRFDSDGNPIDAAPVVIAKTPLISSGLSITSRPGEYFLTWQTSFSSTSVGINHALAARFTAGGIPLDLSPLRVATGSAQDRSVAAVPLDTGYRVAYQGSDLRYIQRIFTKTVETIPSGPWRNQDTATVDLPGALQVDEDTLLLSGAGKGNREAKENFQFAYRAIDGDFDFVAHVSAATLTTPRAFAGMMVRSDATDTQRSLSLGFTEENKLRIEPIGFEVGSPLTAHSMTEPPRWLRLTRVGNAIAGLVSTEGAEWTLVALGSTGPTNVVLAGPFVGSGERNILATAQFRTEGPTKLREPIVTQTPTEVVFRLSKPSDFLGREPPGLLLASPPASIYVLEVSTNLMEWKEGSAITNHWGIGSFGDPRLGSNPSGFFRLRSLP